MNRAIVWSLLCASLAAGCGDGDDAAPAPHGSDYTTTEASLCDFESTCEHESDKAALCRQTLNEALSEGLLDQASADACASCLRSKSCGGIDACYADDPGCQAVRSGLESALAD